MIEALNLGRVPDDQPANASSTSPVVAAATALLATLDDAQRSAVSFAFHDDAQRVRWSNFPTDGFQRAGIRMGDLSPTQRDTVFAVLEATLSAQGYQQGFRLCLEARCAAGDAAGRNRRAAERFQRF
jgi:hypothetical protein